jgi:hypothetical protein
MRKSNLARRHALMMHLADTTKSETQAGANGVAQPRPSVTSEAAVESAGKSEPPHRSCEVR